MSNKESLEFQKTLVWTLFFIIIAFVTGFGTCTFTLIIFSLSSLLALVGSFHVIGYVIRYVIGEIKDFLVSRENTV